MVHEDYNDGGGDGQVVLLMDAGGDIGDGL